MDANQPWSFRSPYICTAPGLRDGRFRLSLGGGAYTIMPELLTVWRGILVCNECGAKLPALERELTIQSAEDELVIIGHVIAAGSNHVANQCESHMRPAIPEISSVSAATAARTATHSGHLRFMAKAAQSTFRPRAE